ncbi:MAG: 3-oxoacyl-ACP reductase family protein [bacterium]
MIEFQGKTALITGGSRGIGRACALTLAKLGCQVAVCYQRNEAAANEVVQAANQSGVAACAYRADVTQVDQIEALVQSVLKDFKRIDVLINSAGISQVVSVPDLTEQDWDRMMAINLKGAFFCCQVVLKHMQAQKGGRIVNVASTAGQMGGFIVGVNYSASKAGVICLTKSLSKYALPYGVAINCVAPGLIDTEMTTAYPSEKAGPLVDSIPMKRMGSAQEVANGIVFLASDAASYITGTTLYINGGTYLG